MHDPSQVRFWRLISGEVAVGIALADRPPASLKFSRENFSARGSNSHGLVFCDGRQPAEAVGVVAVHDPKESLLQLFSDRPARTLAHHDMIHRTDGRYFGSGPGEKDFVGDIEHLTRYQSFRYRNAQRLG